jgi:uncharacterized membrane protein YtjA (UPF0391 family)
LLSNFNTDALHASANQENFMGLLKWAIIAMVIAGIAALFGFGNIAAGAADVAKVLFYIFLVIFLLLVAISIATYKSVTGPS